MNDDSFFKRKPKPEYYYEKPEYVLRKFKRPDKKTLKNAHNTSVDSRQDENEKNDGQTNKISLSNY